MMRRFTSAPKPAARVFSYMSVQVLARRRAARSARRHSARGSTRPRPARRCSRPAARIWCAAARPRRSRRPASFSHSMPCSHSASISARHAVDAVFLRNADPQALESTCATAAAKSGTGSRRRGRVLRDRGRPCACSRIAAVLDGARHRPGLVERAGEGDDAPARAAAVGRLDADDAGEDGRLADRAAGVGAGRARHESAATAAAEPPDEPPGTSWRLSPRRFHGIARRRRNSWSRWTSPWRTRRG